MQIQADSKPYDDINITPMLDLAYVLLVIFIVTAPIVARPRWAPQPRRPRPRW